MFPMDNQNLWPGFHGRTNTDIINQWLAGEETEGRSSSGSVSFYGDTLYSHHQPLARKVNGLSLVCRRLYSAASSKHRTQLYRELPASAIVIHVDDVTQPLSPEWSDVSRLFDLTDTVTHLVAADWCAEHGYTEVEAALRASVPDRDQ